MCCMHHDVPAVEGHHEALREELDVGGVQEEDEVVLDVGHRGGGGLCPPFELLAITFKKTLRVLLSVNKPQVRWTV